MNDLYNNNTNLVSAAGQVTMDPVFSHTVFGENFYLLGLKVFRQSGAFDMLPLMVSERLLDMDKSYLARHLHVKGQFRSFNQQGQDKRHLLLSLFVRDLCFVDESTDCGLNSIILEGFLCRKPIFRVTPKGREITDFMIAVNRSFGQSDYIPCICWGRTARYLNKMDVGCRLHVEGRIQSRNYLKRMESGKLLKKTAYEISVMTLSLLKDEEKMDTLLVADPN